MSHILQRIIAGVVVTLLLWAGLWGYGYYYDHRKPNFERNAVLYIYPGMTAETVMDSVRTKAGVLNAESLSRTFSDVTPRPGRYEIAPSMTSAALARKIEKGWEDEMSLTVAPVFRYPAEVAELMGAQLMISPEDIRTALEDKDFLSGYGFTPETALALILPDTYRVRWSIGVKELFDRLKKEYDRYWNDGRRAKAAAQGLTPVEAAILASIVNEETKYQPEMAKIAGVYLNRLHSKGWLLQADPTVSYCFDYKLTRVLNRHLEVDSPYNTYKYEGLPPGLISCAPKACIEAVLNPSSEANYFFCASPALDGTHRFARTGAQHAANARAYQAALSRLK